MSKLALLFAGQGAQKTGMGKDLYDNDAEARKIFDDAEKIVPGIREMCFSGDQEELNETINTQPAVFTVDIACYAAFAAKGFTPHAGAGFSLGEYAALTASGAMPFEDTLKLVVKRAKWMQKEAEKHGGGMAAVLGKTAGEVEAIVAELAEKDGVLQAVNYNSPGQTVVAGDEAGIKRLLRHGKENKVRVMQLPVNGAFHSVLMANVTDKIYDFISNIDFGKPAYDLYANKTAQKYDEVNFKRILADQSKSPVLFEQIVRELMGEGFDTFVEVGPGSTLTGFVKRIDKGLNIFNVNDTESLNATAGGLKALGF